MNEPPTPPGNPPSTPLGRLPPAAHALLLPAGAVVIALELILIPHRRELSFWGNLLITPIGTLAFFALFLGPLRSPAAAFGLTLRVRRGYRHWLKIGVIAGAAFAALVGLALITFGPPADAASLRLTRRDLIDWYLPVNCVYAPVVEELMNRAMFCAALRSRFSARTAIVGSGLVFALMHVAAGIASPDNLCAGFLFAWAFVSSETIVVPIAMHMAGNLGVGVLRLLL